MPGVHRIGFTQLGDKGAQDRQYRVNIVFVHGLRGHPQRTWEDDAETVSGGGDDTSTVSKRRGIRALFRPKPPPSTENVRDGPPARVFWPEDYLADDIPEARVWTYGYNADTIGGLFEANSKNSVSQHGRDLSVKIERDVENDDPIVFVAHSLGGIIVKDAIRRSEECRKRTKLIVFLGTPHRGSSMAGWGVIASNLARLALQDSHKKLLETLEVNNEVLDNINEEFKTIVHGGNISIHSFHESRGISGMKGLHNKVVDDFSSKLDLPRAIETVESIDANHMQMARCVSRDDARYRAVGGVLKKFVRSGLSGSRELRAQDTDSAAEQSSVARELAGASDDVVLPCYNIPFRRNTRFVGRGAELDAIKDLLFRQRSPSVAIVGLGGVGKTQVALELAYWTKETHQEYSILWVPALSEATFEQAYAEIARKLKIREISDDEDVKVSVRRHLSSGAAGPWLFILDNADDVDMVLHSSGGISQYLPESERGLVVYTTRSPDVASRATDEIELQKMSRQEAKSMLERSLKRKGLIENEARVEELIEELASLPLAIAQAAAYLDRNRLSVDDYLNLLRGTEDDMVSAMSREFHDSTRYPGSQNAVATTWLVSMDQIRRFDPIAAELLSFISQIEPKAIPQSILPKLGSGEMMVHAIGTLCRYAFLERREGSDLLDMHSLVHVVTRLWIERHEGADATGIAAVRQLEAIFPRISHYRVHRTIWRGYLPHALRLLYGTEGCRLMERQELLFRVGQCLHLDRRFKEAIRCFEEVYNWTKERLIEDDDFRLAVELGLGSSYIDDRRFKEATEMLEHVVAARKKTLPEENLYRLSSEHELARAYLSVSRIKEAIEILEHVIAARKILALEDHSRLASEHALATAYLTDGRTREAIEIFEHVVAVERTTLAPEDHSRLTSEHNLAHTYLKDGRTREAIEIFEYIVAVRRKILAPEDDSRLVSEHVLAIAYLKDRRTREAIEILEHVVAVVEKTVAKEDELRSEAKKWLAYAQAKSSEEGISE